MSKFKRLGLAVAFILGLSATDGLASCRVAVNGDDSYWWLHLPPGAYTFTVVGSSPSDNCSVPSYAEWKLNGTLIGTGQSITHTFSGPKDSGSLSTPVNFLTIDIHRTPTTGVVFPESCVQGGACNFNFSSTQNPDIGPGDDEIPMSIKLEFSHIETGYNFQFWTAIDYGEEPPSHRVQNLQHTIFTYAGSRFGQWRVRATADNGGVMGETVEASLMLRPEVPGDEVKFEAIDFFQNVKDPSLESATSPNSIDIAIGKTIGVKAEVRNKISSAPVSGRPVSVRLEINGVQSGQATATSDSSGTIAVAFTPSALAPLVPGLNSIRYIFEAGEGSDPVVFEKNVFAHEKNDPLNFVVLRVAGTDQNRFNQFLQEYSELLKAALPVAEDKIVIQHYDIPEIGSDSKWVLKPYGRAFDDQGRATAHYYRGLDKSAEIFTCGVENVTAFVPENSLGVGRGWSQQFQYGTMVEQGDETGIPGARAEALVGANNYLRTIGVAMEGIGNEIPPSDKGIRTLWEGQGSASIYAENYSSIAWNEISVAPSVVPADFWISRSSYNSVLRKYKFGGTLGSPTGPFPKIDFLQFLIDLANPKKLALKFIKRTAGCLVQRAHPQLPRKIQVLTEQLKELIGVPIESPQNLKASINGTELPAAVSADILKDDRVPYFVRVVDGDQVLHQDSFHALWVESILNRIPDRDILGGVASFEFEVATLIGRLRGSAMAKDYAGASGEVRKSMVSLVKEKVRAPSGAYDSLEMNRDTVTDGLGEISRELTLLAARNPKSGDFLELTSERATFAAGERIDVQIKLLRPPSNTELEPVISIRWNGVPQRDHSLNDQFTSTFSVVAKQVGVNYLEAQLRLRNKREAKGLKDAAVSLRTKRSAFEHELSQERDPDRIQELRNEIDRLGVQIEALEHRLSQMGVAVGKWHNLSVTVH